jgi:triosephosphate isomerase
MRNKIVAGNWKMNLDKEKALGLFNSLNREVVEGVEIIIAPASIYLSSFSENNPIIKLSAQNVSQNSNGAFTGEISSSMLSSLNISYCLVGHSERRTYQNESDELIFEKTKSLLDKGLKPIFCCGEILDDRKNNNAFYVVNKQLHSILNKLNKDQILNVVIAYEPVWAIGTGITASAEDAQEMHQYIRSLLSEKFGEDISSKISILYGGSCKPDNAKELFSQNDIDGGLIGGASLDSDSFLTIAKSF